MALTLVTGPANSAKARVVLDGVRAASDRDPLLVVPTLADVDRYRRELAEDGLVFGARVLRFDDLVVEAAVRAGIDARPLGELSRERIAGSIVRRTELDALAASAATPGFPRAAVRLFSELEVARVGPGRFAGALRAWAGDDARRSAYGAEVARLYGAYRGALERLGRHDRELWSLQVLDALRVRPAAWGATPVFFYGFDDLAPVQRDAVETLASAVGAEVWVSLTFEAGRSAFAGRAATVATLAPLAAGAIHELPARDTHYAPAAREALHALERGLFEAERAPEPVEPGAAVALLEAGGERAEAELVAAEVLDLLAAGIPAEEIAVVVRSPGEGTAPLQRAFAEAGVPLALARSVALGHTALGRTLVALLRCALDGATATDVVAWLRGPGVVGRPELVDALEARVRRHGLATADAALAAWAADERHMPGALERVRTAAGRGPAALCEALSAELEELLARSAADASAAGVAPLLDGPEREEMAAAGAARAALAELARLGREARNHAPEPAELATTLAAVDVRVGDRPAPGRVTICDPLALRARRVRALIACGLQEGAFPRPPKPDPFFSDAERRALATASGVVLPPHEDPGGGAERYLFYATISRPEERLVLAFRTAGDDGEPVVPSAFVDDVRDRFTATLWEGRRSRRLGAVDWPGATTPPPAAAARAAAAAGPRRSPAPIASLRSPSVLAQLRDRPAWSASALEVYADCPVKWFVERYVNAKALEPDPEPMVRGSLAHAALEETLGGLLADTGSARLTPELLPDVRARLRMVLERLEPLIPISPNPERLAAGARRLRADLERHLQASAHDGTRFEPRFLEASFGFEAEDEEDTPLPALELMAPDGPLRLRGRIDRIDVEPGTNRAQVIDYKGKSAPPQEKWLEKHSFQAALYLRAAQELLDLEPAGSFYQPLGKADGRRRGLIVEDADPDLDVVGRDRVAAGEAAATLRAVTELALAAAAEARGGRLEPRPDTCQPNKRGCAYPGLCRCEG